MHDTPQEPDSGGDHVPHPQASTGCGRTMIRVQVPATPYPEALVPDGGSPGVSHSVWLPPKSGPSAHAFSEAALPAWALARIGAQFLAHGGRIGVCHGPGPARTGLEPAPTTYAPGFAWFERFGPDEPLPSADVALVLADPIEHEAPAETGTASRFWRALRQSVSPGGLVLAHTRQIHNPDGMHDPCGYLVTQAHAAGLSYIQHHVLVHTRLLRQPLSAADPAERLPPRCAGTEPVHRLVHSDLLAFLA